MQEVKTCDGNTYEEEPALNLHPIIVEANGKPAFVVLPYAEYLELTHAHNAPIRPLARIPADGSIPHEVVLLMVQNNWSVIRAWLEYLGGGAN
ncbi:hypothetical protein [Achromobacter spanius]|uniref:hypothetical protein n=1 Tax=Achromobacter spanius TaxID=217203 RepID=UPI00382CFBD6